MPILRTSQTGLVTFDISVDTQAGLKVACGLIPHAFDRDITQYRVIENVNGTKSLLLLDKHTHAAGTHPLPFPLGGDADELAKFIERWLQATPTAYTTHQADRSGYSGGDGDFVKGVRLTSYYTDNKIVDYSIKCVLAVTGEWIYYGK